MLPTTGHFKVINCPFYDSCICERPYCHFKHSKKESGKDEELVISELVSQAVHKVLNPELKKEEIVIESKPVESPKIEENCPDNSSNITYNPTPISELNKIKTVNNDHSGETKKVKRHIPIQYTPQRPQTIRQNGYNPKKEAKLYTPVGSIINSDVVYTPSSIIDLLAEGDSIEVNEKSYVPQHSSTTKQLNKVVPTVIYNPTAIDSEKDPEINNINFEYVPTSVKDSTKDDDPFEIACADYLDDFLNDPNLYETADDNEISKSTNSDNLKSEPLKKPHSANTDDILKLLNGDVSKKQVSDTKPKVKVKKSSSSDSSRKRKHDEISKSKYSSDSKSNKSGSDKSSKKSRHEYSKTKRKDTDKPKESSSTKDVSTTKESGSKKIKLSEQTSSKHKSSKDKHSSKSSKSSSSSKHSSSKDKDKKDIKQKNKKYSKHSSSSNTSFKDDVKSQPSTSKISASSSKLKSVVSRDAPVSLTLEEMDMLDVDDLSDYDSDDPTTSLEECKKIFAEYKPPEKNSVDSAPAKQKSVDGDFVAPSSRKRVAHEKQFNTLFTPMTRPAPKKSFTSPAQIMVKRYHTIKEQIHRTPSETVTAHHEPPVGGVKRIARVPNVSSLIDAKKKVDELLKEKSIAQKTPSQSIPKGEKRIPHVPNMATMDIPMVLKADKSKLPINIRSTFVKLMVAACANLYSNKASIYERALNEELICYTKCSALKSYKGCAMLAVSRLRKEANPDNKKVRDDNISIIKRCPLNIISHELTGVNLYNNILRWVLTIEQLEQNGFPFMSSTRGHAVFKDGKNYEQLPRNQHRCSRCKNLYMVNDYGYPMNQEDCIYHPNGRYIYRGESKYICCGGPTSIEGCCTANNHVYEIRNLSKLSGFVTTFEPVDADDPKNHAVYALDCEMIYTTRGMELARVTVVNSNGDTVYETLVKPAGEILDCNTRFSGLTEEMLQTVTTVITDVQATLLLMVNSKTILIGHSLESDLKALRLIHPTIVDTSVLFPHKFGPPKKNSLKSLASDILKKIIQNSESGHDSAEDAITSMELIMWKLKEELKIR